MGSGFGPFDRTPEQFRVSQADGLTAYYGPFAADIVTGTTTPTVGDLQFAPFYTGLGGVISEIAFNVTTGGGAGSLSRAGLYDTDQTLAGGWLQPRNLLVDTGSIDTTGATFKTTVLAQPLVAPPDQLWWLAFMCGVNAPTVTNFTSGWHVLGRSATAAAQFGRIKTGFGFAALPASAPTGLGMMTSAAAMVLVRWLSYNNGLRQGN